LKKKFPKVYKEYEDIQTEMTLKNAPFSNSTYIPDIDIILDQLNTIDEEESNMIGNNYLNMNKLVRISNIVSQISQVKRQPPYNFKKIGYHIQFLQLRIGIFR